VRDRVVHWIANRVRKRWRREWESYDHSPKVAFWPRTRRQAGRQVFRSLIQVNFYRREP
jgi:hypothetical protein